MDAEVYDKIKDRFNNAIKLRDEGRIDEALRILNAINVEYPNQASILGVIGGIYFGIGDLEAARTLLERVVSMSPRSELASLGLFHSLWELGRHEEALSEMKRFLAFADSDEYQRILSSFT